MLNLFNAVFCGWETSERGRFNIRSGRANPLGFKCLRLTNTGRVGRFPKDDERKIVFQDPTVPSRQSLSPGFNSVKDFPEHSRVIHPSDFPLCTYAYAVSYAGAQKVLYVALVDIRIQSITRVSDSTVTANTRAM